jgi:hypothetical protein
MLPLATKEVAEKRLEICRVCEFRTIMPKTHLEICKVCGCMVQAKARLSVATCPKGKW